MNNKKSLLKKRYRQELKKILISLERYQPDKVILYGSILKGKIHDGSDIDLLIIKDSKKSFPERIREVFDLTGSSLIEPLVFTPREINQRLALKDFFFQRIFKEGQVLYEKGSKIMA